MNLVATPSTTNQFIGFLAELQGLPRVHEGFQLPCSPPTVPPGPGEHVKLAEIREREPKGKSLGWKFRRKGRSRGNQITGFLFCQGIKPASYV